MKKSYEEQYLELCQKVLDEGVWVDNERTGKRCLTIINHDMEYDVGNKEFPLLTTKQHFWRSAIAEFTGYLKGYTSASDFRDLGAITWDANSNETKAWLDNPNRKGVDDMGFCYGAVAKNFGGLDLFQQVYEDLCKGVDNRREIVTFYKPDEFDKACLKPCMHSHHFSLLDGTLYLNSTQASVDVPLGLPFNMTQCYFFLELMAQITGHKAGKVFHKLVNVHIYSDQIEGIKEQLTRIPITESKPEFVISPVVKTLEDVNTWFLPKEDTWLYGEYKHHSKIAFPFSS